MRAGDGIHFSAAGADHLSAALFQILDARWRLLAQADLEHPKEVRETEGSTQIPGTYRSNRSSNSGNGSGSSWRPTTTTRPVTPSTSVATTTTTTAAEPPPPSSAPTTTTTSTVTVPTT
jgi:hypothetical protein